MSYKETNNNQALRQVSRHYRAIALDAKDAKVGLRDRMEPGHAWSHCLWESAHVAFWARGNRSERCWARINPENVYALEGFPSGSTYKGWKRKKGEIETKRDENVEAETLTHDGVTGREGG